MLQKPALLVLTTFWVLTGTLLAQRTTGTISGTITDQTGAIVPGSQVMATETATAAATRATANSEGFYVLSNLSAGVYRLRIEKEGFQTAIQERIVVQVDRPVSMDVSLQVGA